MAKFLIGLLLVALLQVTFARDLAQVLDNDIRERLTAYQQFITEDDGSHKEDLQKLITLSESVLNAETAEKKQEIIDGIGAQFSEDFNKYFLAKYEEYQVNEDIKQSIEFYKALIPTQADFKTEIEATVQKLEVLLKETDLKKKEDEYAGLGKEFTAEFQAFLKTSALPKINTELQKTSEFFENLLADKDIQHADEIKELKAKADAALSGDATVEQKREALNEITNPPNAALYSYLQKKFIEKQ